jgi:hypothetical protein
MDNPNGIASLSPGLRGTRYPGFTAQNIFPNPERVASPHHHAAAIQPFQG